jgi:hypothetical protein
VRLGRGGLGRAEIAAELGVGPAALARMERKSPRLAAALARAADAERAWWEGLPREALAAGARFNMGAWLAAMRWRFGAARDEAKGEARGEAGRQAGAGADGAARARAAVAAADPPGRPRAIYILPDNGKERRAPDGTPMTPAMRKAHTLAPIQEEIDRLEARLDHFRELLSEHAAEWEADEARAAEEDDDWDPDDPDDDDPSDGDPGDGDWDETGGWGDDEDDDDRDEVDGDEDDGSADTETHEGDDDDQGDETGDADGATRDRTGGGADGADDRAANRGRGPGADFRRADGSGPVGDVGDGLSADPAGCERAVPAGGAGPPAWAAQPHFGPGGPGAPEGL